MAKEIVKRILITEKGSALSVQNRYCLEVDVKASKPEIRQAVESDPGYTPGNPMLIDCVDLEDATRKAAADSKPGDVVLMSPASASFDQFKNFEVRGNFFKKLVKEL